MVVPIWYLGDRRYLKEVPIVASMKMTARSVEAIRLPAAGQIDYWDADPRVRITRLGGWAEGLGGDVPPR